jgi:hypothetical protein
MTLFKKVFPPLKLSFFMDSVPPNPWCREE